MFAGEDKGERRLVVLKWSDGSVDHFYANKQMETNSFISWKQKKYPDITYQSEKMTVNEFNKRYCSL
jgi:hypothetical protein